jgi:predicted transcriptional regulator
MHSDFIELISMTDDEYSKYLDCVLKDLGLTIKEFRDISSEVIEELPF